jgi:hypothetical protein
MRSATFCAIAFALFLAPATALAADRGRGEIGLDAGYADLDDEQGGGGPLVAIRGGYHFTTWFELEGEAARLLPDCPADECSDLWIGLINFVFSANPTPSISPYLLFGAGYTDFDEEPEFTLFEDTFEGQAVFKTAAGSRFFFGADSRTAVRFEVSATFFEDYNNANAQIGLLWRVGGGR